MKRLPALMDRRMIHEETGLPLSTCETLMRACPLVTFPGVRRVFVLREDFDTALSLGGRRGRTS